VVAIRENRLRLPASVSRERRTKHLADCTPDLLVCHSVGWLLHDTEQVKVIVPHLIEADPTTSIAAQGRGDLVIPCAAILSMRELSA
jgi:hypothetical protein